MRKQSPETRQQWWGQGQKSSQELGLELGVGWLAARETGGLDGF